MVEVPIWVYFVFGGLALIIILTGFWAVMRLIKEIKLTKVKKQENKHKDNSVISFFLAGIFFLALSTFTPFVFYEFSLLKVLFLIFFLGYFIVFLLGGLYSLKKRKSKKILSVVKIIGFISFFSIFSGFLIWSIHKLEFYKIVIFVFVCILSLPFFRKYFYAK